MYMLGVNKNRLKAFKLYLFRKRKVDKDPKSKGYDKTVFVGEERTTCNFICSFNLTFFYMYILAINTFISTCCLLYTCATDIIIDLS